MLFGTTAAGARNANILDLRWNRPRFGLCGHLSRTVKTSMTGDDFCCEGSSRALPAHPHYFWLARLARCAGTGAGGWLAHSFQQVFQNYGIVALFILSGKEQC